MSRRNVVAAACAIAVTLFLALAAGAAATTEGIDIDKTLTTATGRFDFTGNGISGSCDVTVTKTYIAELVPVNRRGPLTKIGRLGSGRTNNCTFPTGFLNLPTELNGRTAIGPNADSWDIIFVSTNLTTRDINISILDVQIEITGGFTCLYRGNLAGTIPAGRNVLTFVTMFTKFSGNAACPVLLTVTGALTETPANTYTVLLTR